MKAFQAVVFCFVLLISNNVYSQLIPDDYERVDVNFSDFVKDDVGTAIVWPAIDFVLVSMDSFPNAPILSANGVTANLTSNRNSATFYIDESYRQIYMQISLHADIDYKKEKPTDPDWHVVCVTSDGQTRYLLDKDDMSILVKPSLNGYGSIGCHLGHGNYATLKVTNLIVWIKTVPDEEEPAEEDLSDIDSEDECRVASNSTLSIDRLSLNEVIPLVGVPFSLNYSSFWYQKRSTVNMKFLGLGGWAPSQLKYYDTKKERLLSGDGGSYPMSAQETGDGGYYIASSDGSLIHYFNANGFHLKTKDSLTGVVIYSYEYDSAGKITKITDRFNNQTKFQYNGNIVSLISPYGQISKLVLDENGFLSSVTNPNNEAYQVTHSSSGQMLTYEKPMGQKSQVFYDADGFVTKDLGAGGDFISLIRSFDSKTNIQTVTSTTATGVTTRYITDKTGNKTARSVHSSDGGISESTSVSVGDEGSRDKYGNNYSSISVNDQRFGDMSPYVQSSIYKIPGSNIEIRKDVNKSVLLSNPNDPLSLSQLSETTKLQNDASKIYTNNYDAQTRIMSSISPLNRSVKRKLNDRGLASSVQIGNLIPTNFSYDARGRLTKISQQNRNMNFAYDNRGNLSKSTDYLDRATRFEYDGANRVTKKILPDGKFIKMAYDANGNLASITPAEKPEHKFIYGLMDLASNYIPPKIKNQIIGATSYSYNLDKKISQISRGDGENINFSYNANSGLLESIITSKGNYSFLYQPNTDLVKELVSPDQEKMNFDYMGNILRKIDNSGVIKSAIQFDYKNNGDISAISVSGIDQSKTSTVSLDYDTDDLLIKAGNQNLTRNSFGAISKSQLGKVTQNIQYDDFGQVTKEHYQIGNKVAYEQIFKRDLSGRIEEIQTSSGKREKYVYDLQGRLEKVYSDRRLVTEYKYDANGNRLEKKSNSRSIRAEYDAQDRLIKYGKTEYEYNANGDLISKSEAKDHHGFFGWLHRHRKNRTEYQYDVFGNLKTVKFPSGKTIEYLVDGYNRRIGKKVNGKLVQGFIYQNQTQIAAELDGQGNIVRRYVYSSKPNTPDYMIENNKEFRIISDQIGTPRLIVDAASGKVVESFEYDEFGILEDCDSKKMNFPIGFAGGLWDKDTELVRFGARDYDPTIGRWTSKDPIGFAGGDTNLYGYVLQDPVNFIDPTGLEMSAYEREVWNRLPEIVYYWLVEYPRDKALEEKRKKQRESEDRGLKFPPNKTPIESILPPPFKRPGFSDNGDQCG